ncbi:MAG: glutamine--fructose-6-phosphate transaminase (isomerizing) [Chloroflexi bacterium]|nr:glutamine--fructose-6-phosphate transaminase (isomerizing) [Chloroflexota bacterium]
MCGIVGYVGGRDAAPIILDGLGRLEYRGYDSAGLAVQNGGGVQIRRDVGKLANLRATVARNPVDGHIGIGHTRWATHGVPAERNAHPHISMNGDFVLVHNGIVENYLPLKEELLRDGVTFTSETDTEVIVHLIEKYAQQADDEESIVEAVREAVARLTGAHAIVVLPTRRPHLLIAIRIGNAGGVAVGLGDGENFIASDIPAILEHTRRIIYLEHRHMAVIRADTTTITTLDGAMIKPQVHHIAFDAVSAAKGEFKHFMQKEIFEQARGITDTLAGRVDREHAQIVLHDLNLTPEHAASINRVVSVACGTSYYSALVGKFYLEKLARVAVEVEYGSEYRYRDPLLTPGTAVLAITQSGETVDTLAAMEHARANGSTVWSIVNSIGSQAMRLADGFIPMNVGPEIGVASTKTFTASIVDQYLLALTLGEARGVLTAALRRQYVEDLARLPDILGRVIQLDDEIRLLSGSLYGFRDFLFLGRGIQYPIALEGALKLKEISYIHAEGYPAGEMKHGPIALIDADMPVVAIALQDALYDKMISQIEQVKARGGRVIAIATEGDATIASKADHVLYLPACPPLLSPVMTVLPMQLLAYHIAVWRGTDVDQPRNLAKSVTVE